MFPSVGFFRFITGFDKPIEALTGALNERNADEITGGLIVLPEAFNIGRYYHDSGTCDYDARVLNELQARASQWGVAFVAGLVISDGSKVTPYSSAYLIHGSGHTLMSRKIICDSPQLFRSCKEGFDIHNPVTHQGVTIGALICVDAEPCNSDIAPIRKKRIQGASPQILCVPACMASFYNSEGMAGDWPEQYFVLANSHRAGCRSVIAYKGKVVATDEGITKNSFVLSRTSPNTRLLSGEETHRV